MGKIEKKEWRMLGAPAVLNTVVSTGLSDKKTLGKDALNTVYGLNTSAATNSPWGL